MRVTKQQTFEFDIVSNAINIYEFHPSFVTRFVLRSGRSSLTKTSPESAPFPITSNITPIPPKDWNVELERFKGEQFTPPHGTDATLAIIYFSPPADDGGLTIDRYHVLVRHLEDNGHRGGSWSVADEVDILKSSPTRVVLGECR